MIGWLLRRWAAWQLAKDDGSGEAVAILAEVVTRSRDRAVREMALAVLNRLRTQDAINGFCRVWVETRHEDLTEILRSRRYVATERRLRVLSALKVGALDVVKRGGVEVLDFLLAALNDRDTQVATVAASCVSALENRVVIDELCRRWVESRSSQLDGIIRQGVYVASQPVAVRVLTALKFNQVQKIRDGGIEVLDCVLKALDDRDMEVVRSANVCAVSLTNRGAIDELCKRWAGSRNKRLEGIIGQGGYIASQPIEVRVLTALKFNQIQEFANADIDILDYLIKALDDADSKIIEVAEICIRQLRNQQTIDSLCSRWVQNRNQQLEKIIRQGNYLPSQPIRVRILVALKFNQFQAIDLKEAMTVDILLAAMNDKDSQIVKFANYSLTHLKDKAIIDSLCKRWIENPSKLLENIIREGGYEPEEASDKALFYFLMDEWQKYEDLDFDQSLLSKAYRSANQGIQNRISDKSRKAGRSEFIKIITNSNRSFDDEKMTDQDWETFIDILASNPDRKVIWRFLYNAPAIRSKQLLDKLSKASFQWFKDEEKKIVIELFNQCQNIKEQDFTLGTLTKTLTGHNDSICSLVISPDNRVLASGGSSRCRSIKLWSLPEGKCIKTIETGHDSAIYSLVISPDGQILVSGSKDKNIKLWSFPNGNHIKTIETGHTFFRDGLSLAISPNGRILFSTGGDCLLNLWSLPDGNHIKTVKLPFPGDRGLVISPNGEMLAFCSEKTSIGVNKLPININEITNSYWEFSYDNTKRFRSDDDDDNDISVHDFVISPDSKILFSASSKIDLWNLQSSKHMKSFTHKFNMSLAISPNQKILVSGGADNNIYLWSLPDGNLIRTLSSNNPWVEKLVVSPNSRILVSGHWNNNICLWDLPKNISISKLSTKDVDEIEAMMKDSNLERSYFNVLKFTLFLIRLRQQFDIDIEDVSSDVQFSEFDIEIDG
ncbi:MULTISPECIES: WD40 repeat domain-containing protein [Pseudanabaena]|uniref:WD40 repeat domain-containing protein n=1 Tax=Pseudanabaena TaxID=1152 RepID=UPI00247972D3|nr:MULTISPECIES: WD40 repeat domain-containing protein [Pseudanabaena]MEA5490219.1 WD40 repeat domain-containing protein [Pseudanabaena sp. CCNP1317]WGS74692.1 WD40 repeat domain-containing protein [Pseudanabaena galeata CCNP1313]